jgi:hypothetical protein
MPEPFRRALTQAPDLSAQTIAIALEGWGSYPPAGVPWTTHELFVKAAARSWGWQPRFVGPDGRRRFFAEALAWEHAHGMADVHEDEAHDA